MSKLDPIKEMKKCHEAVLKQLDDIENIRPELKSNTKKAYESLEDFFKFVDTSFALHTRDEEQALFPLLGPKICAHACGAHGGITPVEVMMKDHKDVHASIEVVKLLMKYTKDKKFSDSKNKLLEEIDYRINFISNTMRDHIWKENNVLYGLAEEFLTKKDLSEVGKRMDYFRNTTEFTCDHT